jgi:hypothetical protein
MTNADTAAYTESLCKQNAALINALVEISIIEGWEEIEAAREIAVAALAATGSAS